MKEIIKYIYGEDKVEYIHEKINEIIEKHSPINVKTKGWSQKDSFLITYGDSLLSKDKTPLSSLCDFLETNVKDAISFVHILPFCPYSSDDGFSVIDYRQVDKNLGTWDDVSKLSKNYRPVFDAVLNHVSQESEYVKGFLRGDKQYKDFCVAFDKENVPDLTAVVRPRTLPLLHSFDSHEGEKLLWTTFSKDQVDLNFANPEVLLEILDVLLFYIKMGSGMIRLDAIPFLWKEIGTNCSHLPKTHAVVKLVRKVYDKACKDAILLTETNVPHEENISYFGEPKGSEAQMIYNFSLSPLSLYAIHSGDASALNKWAKQVTKINDNATFLNISATHDGIGMRPTEGLLTNEQRQELADIATNHNGKVSYKSMPDGSQVPYELNVNYFDAVNNPNENTPIDLQVSRFMAAQAIPLSFIGIPAIYIHSLLGSRNDTEGAEKSGIPRRINREKLCVNKIEEELKNKGNIRNLVFTKYIDLLNTRSKEECFHPNAEQKTFDNQKETVIIERAIRGRKLLAIINISNKTIDSFLPNEWQNQDLTNIITNQETKTQETIKLNPYEILWLKLK